MRAAVSACCLALLVLFFASSAFAAAEVVVHDRVAVVGEKTRIEVETRGRFFSAGGVVVTLSVDDRPAGTALSGGDGRAYKEFVPRKKGSSRVSAETATGKGSGIMLCIDRGDRIVVVSAEGGLFEGIFPREPRPGSAEALERLSEKFPVVILQTGVLPYRHLKSWLAENKADYLPVIPWAEGSVFEGFREKGIRIEAVVGSEAVISSAREYTKKAFAFGEAEGAETVNDWQEIVQGLSVK